MNANGPRRGSSILHAILPTVALGALAVGFLLVVGSAGETLGYDFDAYRAAAERVISGEPLYQQGVDTAGGYAIYLYPPPFVLAFLPFALLSEEVALAVWLTLLVGAFLGGALLLPVRCDVRWVIVLLGGLSWPLLYSVKLGQVGSILFFLLAVGWRSMDQPVTLGLSIAAGTIVKLQPLVLLAWAAATRRREAAAVGVVTLVGVAAVATVVTGPGAWSDYVSLLAAVNEPVTTPHNFTPGAIAYQLGLPVGFAAALQWLNVGAVVLLVGWSWFQLGPVPSYLATVVGSQLVSPLLWDHYAVLLLLPVAWLLERGRWWGIVIPLATWLPLVLLTPAIVYPVVFWGSLLSVLTVGWRERPSGDQALLAGQGGKAPA